MSEQLEHELRAAAERASQTSQGAACLLRLDAPGHDLAVAVAAGRVDRDVDELAIPQTPFRIASITKTYTAVVVLQLAAEGRIGLDDRVVDHLPGDLSDLLGRLHVLDGVSRGHEMTIRQLLTHASGLFDYASCESFFATIAADPTQPWTPRRLLEGAAEWGEPHFAPGTGYGYAYSDTGYVVLGVMIEHLDGIELHDSYRRRILDPLEMDDTYLEGYEPHRGPPMAHTYLGEVDTTVIHGSADWAGGGLVSTTADLVIFGHGLFDGRLLGGPWLDVAADYGFRTLDPARHTPGYVGYGCGIDARESNGLVWRGHRGNWGALLHVEPRSGVVITGSVNDAAHRPDGLFHEVVEIAVRHGLTGDVGVPGESR